MKKSLLLLLFFASLAHIARAQDIDKKLMERIDSVLLFTGQSNFERTLDFTYPKLFTIVTRAQMLEVLKGALETEEYSASFDSVKLIKAHPSFTVDKGTYVKINHSMVMVMKFKESVDTTENEDLNLMVAMMEEGYGKENVRFNKATSTFRIFMQATLLAIKDELSPEWMFINFDEDEESPILPLLFSEEVIKKLKSP